jgi:hypothetical protein
MNETPSREPLGLVGAINRAEARDENPYRSPLSHGGKAKFDHFAILIPVAAFFAAVAMVGIGIGCLCIPIAEFSDKSRMAEIDRVFNLAMPLGLMAAVFGLLVCALGAALEYLRIDPPKRKVSP